ncbi:hypothetical protein PQD13_gp76 [Gordonia phage Clawz]|uniref:Uncharacterized protein n=1 Tax=Gordonia phage Clawz TaxID=2743910 RepID=A0AAE7K684_9CAUD|nr:hypothetical protein PQD13_gp76 [Gordonia phage Clawz]QKY79988.1 hypothetical protein SEA_CLAWZ_76 [Gordonia phage Clawz]
MPERQITSEATPLTEIGVPVAVIRGTDRLFGCSRKKMDARIAELIRLTAVDVMDMESVGWTKLRETRRVLAHHGHRLRLDPPLADEDVDPNARGELTADEIARLRVRVIRLRKELSEILHVLSPAETEPEPEHRVIARPFSPADMPRSI